MLGIALELLYLASDLIDISKQSTRRFAIKASGGDEGIVPLLSLRPRTGVELGPIIPTLLRRERCKITPTGPRIKSFSVRFLMRSQVVFSILQVLFSVRMKTVIHRLYRDRNLFMTSSPGMALTIPSSISLSRSSASLVQSASILF